MGYYPVFTYGSLKSGLENSMLLNDARLVGGTITKREFKLLSVDGMYPALFDAATAVPEDNYAATGRIQGELYIVDDETRAMLDKLERLGELYSVSVEEIDTVILETKAGNHEFDTALVYVAMPGFIEDILTNDKRRRTTSDFITMQNGVVSWIHPVFPTELMADLYSNNASPSQVSAQLIRELWATQNLL